MPWEGPRLGKGGSRAPCVSLCLGVMVRLQDTPIAGQECQRREPAHPPLEIYLLLLAAPDQVLRVYSQVLLSP